MQKIFKEWFKKHFTDLFEPSDFLFEVWMGGVRYGRALTKFYIGILELRIGCYKDEIAQLKKELHTARAAALSEGLHAAALESKLLENRTLTEVDHG